ncbi:MAG: peptidase M14, partial [Dokdonella sp.]|nr:peptidase M14 [Dokdonella sp.]
LDLHGIEYRRLAQAWPGAETETFRATSKKFGDASFEGRQTLTLEGRWSAAVNDIPAGALFVPIAQAKSRLVVALFEPQAPDSFVAWGDFNTAFEQKEYMEAYVAEDVARAMLDNDEALRAEFVQRLAEDPAFAASPDQRLEFFARRHASWDERRDLYPVMRIDTVPGHR